MGKFIDLTGKTFGRWTVKQRAAGRGSITRWLCVCDCTPGVEVSVAAGNLRSGGSKSCGCLSLEHRTAALTTHGKRRAGVKSRAYNAWVGIKDRCLNPKNASYGDYGARGIKVCPEWLESFDAFFRDMGGEPPPGFSVERRDNNLGYCPENCEWASRKVQNRNQRSNRVISYRGKTATLAEHCEDAGLRYGMVQHRLSTYGWSIDEAFSTPAYGIRNRREDG